MAEYPPIVEKYDKKYFFSDIKVFMIFQPHPQYFYLKIAESSERYFGRILTDDFLGDDIRNIEVVFFSNSDTFGFFYLELISCAFKMSNLAPALFRANSTKSGCFFELRQPDRNLNLV